MSETGSVTQEEFCPLESRTHKIAAFTTFEFITFASEKVKIGSRTDAARL